MTASAPQTCPNCGAAASGKFCASCGAPLGAHHCASCGASLAAGARFCQQCGTPAGGVRPAAGSAASLAPLPARDRTAWVVAGTLIVVTLAAVAYFATRRAAPSVPSMANAGNAVPGAADAGNTGGTPAVAAPDISNMTPREQYDRLVARITRAQDAGDSVTVINFTPMALGAYANLPPGDRDINARFHAAVMEARVGMVANSKALADSILSESPDNLLGYVARAAAGDSATARAARAAFRAHYDAELKKTRPEYAANRDFLEKYRKGEGAH